MKSLKFLFVFALVIPFLLATSQPAFTAPIITDYSGGATYTSYYGSTAGDTVGFSFTADSDLTVTMLGILMDPVDGVMDYSHQVGLWRTSDQVLLGSVTVNPASTQIGDFLYEPLGVQIDLFAGTGYTLGALYYGSGNDWYVSGPSTLLTDYISHAVYPAASELGFVFPVLEDSMNLARLGPNAWVEETAVPEPFTLLLLGSGLIGLAGLRRKV